LRHEQFELLRRALIRSVLDGDGCATPELRRSAYSNADLRNPLDDLIDKVVSNSHAITNSDIEAVKRTGVNEDQIFELVICAAIGEASRRYESVLRVLNSDSR
jgi:hypothetical protein